MFAIPPGNLGDALIRLGGQAGISVGINDPGLADARTKGLRGRYSTAAGLRLLLAGTGADFAFVDDRTVRIFWAVIPPPRPAATPRAPMIPAIDTSIVVTASKQNTPLKHYAGTATVLQLDRDTTAREASRGTEAIVARLPILTATSLGAGRDKLFIRGIADSSFNGPSQSTVGLYLGEVRMTYNAPDPDLNLYDIGRVEVLEGPQGTLYGTGSLGGIIRLVPNLPDPSRIGGSFSLGGAALAGGSTGGDIAAMVNLPLTDGRLALRGVAYAAHHPGYIDDPGRGLRDINGSNIKGGRVAVAFRPGGGWTITVGGMLQSITTRDGQYVLRGGPRLTRRSNFAQPFDNDYRLASVSVAKQWSAVELTSTSAVVWHDIATRFDATGYSGTVGPIQFDEAITTTLYSHETRLANRDGRRPWVAGISILHDVTRLNRDLGPPGVAEPITGIRNTTSEIALFGQYSLPLLPRTMLIAGGRLTYGRSAAALLDEPAVDAALPAQSVWRFAPTIALSWQASDRLIGFVRFQKADRAGGVEVAPSGDAELSRRYASDSVAMAELGFRLGTGGTGRFSAGATLSMARWTGVQADLIDINGLPYTANIGDGRIYALDAQFEWRPVGGLTLGASTFFNLSRLNRPAPAFATASDRELPNIAEEGAQVRAGYTVALSPTVDLTVDGSLRYVGASQLGIGFPLDVAQGDFAEAAAGARLARGQWGLSFDITNLGNIHGNRFAYGNPFGLTARNQITPLRPRTLRIGIDARF